MNHTAGSLALEAPLSVEPIRHSESYTTHLALSDIEMLFSESASTGLLPLLARVFSGLEMPIGQSGTSFGNRDLVADAEATGDFFHSRSAKLRSIQSAVNVALGEDVSEVNTLARKIAGLTTRITRRETHSIGELRRQREALVWQLSAIVESRELESEGSYRIFVGNNRLLVLDGHAAILAVERSQGTGWLTVRLGLDDITSEVAGGRMKARIVLRDEMIPRYLWSLDRLAYDISDAANRTGWQLFAPLATVPGAARAIGVSTNAAAALKQPEVSNNRASESVGAITEEYQNLLYTIGSDAAIAELTAREHEALTQQLENRRHSPANETSGRTPVDMHQFQRAHEASIQVERAMEDLLQIALTIGV
jgi:flagellar hook-associated protein FlgK